MKMLADSLVYHPSVSHYLRFVATTVGRDKLLRTVQYFARFYAWYLLRTNAFTSSILPWDATKRQFGLVRKALRAGKSLEHIKAAALAADSKSLPAFLKYTAVGRQIAYAGYLTLDTLLLPDALGIRPSPAAKHLQRIAYRFWAVGILFSLTSQLFTLNQLKAREARIDRKDGEGVVESKRIKRFVSPLPSSLPSLPVNPKRSSLSSEKSATQLQLLCDICDLTIPASALGWANFDDGFVGLAGTLSSLIGVYNQWNKTA